MLMSPMDRYLWIQNSEQVDLDQFREDFRLLVERHMGASPAPRTWRQVATAISCEYIYPHLLDDEWTTSSNMAKNHGRLRPQRKRHPHPKHGRHLQNAGRLPQMA